ncbi:hypothetical protein B0T24DRAFT_643728 [Lasiosphaeria ovina]|uniref:Uncharacterized protein n=1 Tax=Lasiosphaeria ovina TaxID=92902 RepID=A0AAE0JSC3_9PEZI|nr:hypothetical protein B0T24DRAFT_643728 [Lasiosphaeria ovina]
MVLKHLQAHRPNDKYCYVRATPVPLPLPLLIPNQPDGSKQEHTRRLVRCVRYDFAKKRYWAPGDIRSDIEADAFGSFLANPDSFPLNKKGKASIRAHSEDGGSFDLPRFEKLSGPESVFYISLGCTPLAASNLVIPSLMVDVDLLDVISYIERGRCGMCGGTRTICPGCTGGPASKFRVFMGCGVDLVCPLCMGQELAEDHKDFLQVRYDDMDDADESDPEAEAMEERIRERANQLDYDW